MACGFIFESLSAFLAVALLTTSTIQITSLYVQGGSRDSCVLFVEDLFIHMAASIEQIFR